MSLLRRLSCRSLFRAYEKEKAQPPEPKVEFDPTTMDIVEVLGRPMPRSSVAYLCLCADGQH